ncbi:MAG: tetratricopeptide repeat protein, partial [Deltaproteobacteria bacterium]
MRLPAPSPLAPVLAVALLAFAGAAAVEATVGQHYVDRVTMVIAAPSGDAGDETSEAPSAEALSPAHEQARTLARRGRVDEALVQLDALLAEVPDHGPLRAEVGFWLLAEGDTARARAELERAAAAAPDNAWIHLTLGRARSTDGDLEGAQAAYERALALHPAYTTARVSLGVVLRKRGELDASIALLEEAAETGSNEEEARALVALGRSYLAAGRVPAAVEALEQAILHAPADIDVRLGAARAWLFEAPPELRGRAVAVLDETARMAPDVAEVHSARGRALEMTGDAVGAREAYRTALTLDPHYAYVQRRLIRLALEEGDLDVARAQAAQLVEVNPEEAEHHVLAGLVAVAAERPSDARAAYEEAIRRAGGSYPEASYNLG